MLEFHAHNSPVWSGLELKTFLFWVKYPLIYPTCACWWYPLALAVTVTDITILLVDIKRCILEREGLWWHAQGYLPRKKVGFHFSCIVLISMTRFLPELGIKPGTSGPRPSYPLSYRLTPILDWKRVKGPSADPVINTLILSSITRLSTKHWLIFVIATQRNNALPMMQCLCYLCRYYGLSKQSS